TREASLRSRAGFGSEARSCHVARSAGVSAGHPFDEAAKLVQPPRRVNVTPEIRGGAAPPRIRVLFARTLGAFGLHLVGRDRLALVAPRRTLVVDDVGDIRITERWAERRHRARI